MKQKTVINGYPIPGGKGGWAVRRAGEIIISQPGIGQSKLLESAADWAGLNLGTAGWITSPSDKSPAGKLWTRVKEGRGYSLHPNEFTQQATGALDLVKEEVANDYDKLESIGIKPGDLVSAKHTVWNTTTGTTIESIGPFTGWTFEHHPGFKKSDVFSSTREVMVALNERFPSHGNNSSSYWWSRPLYAQVVTQDGIINVMPPNVKKLTECTRVS